LEESDLALSEDLAPEGLDLDARDELIGVSGLVHVEAQVQKLDQALLVQGRLSLVLDCECARCLRPFRRKLVVDPWTVHLPLTGEEAVVAEGDFVDLTPSLREDIFLAFPQHPLCTPECQGMLRGPSCPGASGSNTGGSTSPWADLDKLNLER